MKQDNKIIMFMIIGLILFTIIYTYIVFTTDLFTFTSEEYLSTRCKTDLLGLKIYSVGNCYDKIKTIDLIQLAELIDKSSNKNK